MSSIYIDSIKSLIKTFSGLNVEGALNEKFLETLRKWRLSYSSEEEIYKALTNDKNLLYNFLSEITINESYFYRTPSQFKIIDKILKQFDEIEQINILSIGCSNGCEPYTIAIEILENAPKYKEKVKITGIDINEKVLKYAEKGVYNKWYLRNLAEPLLDKYFKKINENQFALTNEVKSMVTFIQANIFNYYKMHNHIIYCRNFLIYFKKEDIIKAAEKIKEIAHEKAYIIFGNSDILSLPKNIFVREEFDNVIVFRKEKYDKEISFQKSKISVDDKIKKPSVITDFKIRSKRSSEKKETEYFEKGVTYLVQDRPKEAIIFFRKIIDEINPTNIRAKLFLVLASLKMNDYETAKTYLSTLIKGNYLNYEVFLLNGILKYLQNDFLDALENFRKAIYLKNETPAGWYYYGICLKNLGEKSEAKKAFEKALYFIENSDEDLTFLLGDITKEGLKKILKLYLENS